MLIVCFARRKHTAVAVGEQSRRRSGEEKQPLSRKKTVQMVMRSSNRVDDLLKMGVRSSQEAKRVGLRKCSCSGEDERTRNRAGTRNSCTGGEE